MDKEYIKAKLSNLPNSPGSYQDEGTGMEKSFMSERQKTFITA